MHVTVKWFGEQFNINLHSKDGASEFLSVKGCRIKEHDGKEFIAFPSQKNEKTGKWWNHVWATDAFQAHVIPIARAAQPKDQKQPAPKKGAGAFADMPDDIPF